MKKFGSPAPRALYIASASLISIAAATPALAQSQPESTAQPTAQPTTTPAQAAAAQAEPATGNADIVVTAQFREQRLQDTPLSITAVSAEMLEARSQRNLSEITNQAPNVQLRQQGASFGDSVSAFIRGVGQGDFDPAYEPGVGLYIDDVYYSSLSGANFELVDLERVEVLRGPQGTLEGRNSEGGAIRLISRRPDADGGGFVEATYGDRNLVAFRGGANFTIADGLYARISGTTRQQEGYVARIDYGCAHPGSGIAPLRGTGDCVIDHQGGVGHTGVRGQLRYNPHPGVDVLLSADYTHIDQTNTAGVLVFANLDNPNTNAAPGVPYDSRFFCGRFCNYATTGQAAGAWAGGPPFGGFPLFGTSGDDHQVFNGWNTALNVDLRLSQSLNFQSITAYRNWNLRFNSDDDLSPATIGFGEDRLDYWFFSQEARLNGNFGSALQYTLGAYYAAQRTTYYTLQDIRYAPIPLQFVGNDPVRAHNYAFFGTVIWNPLAGLTFTGGLRYTNEHKDYTFHRTNIDGSANLFLGALDGVVGNYDGNRVDYRASIDYRFSPQVLVYGTVSTGFKGGGINPRPFNPPQARPFNPEVLTNYEVGFKTDLFNRALRFNVSAFYDRFSNIQIPVLSCPQFGGPGPCALPENAGNDDFYGVEAEAFLRPVAGLQIDASASYLHTNVRCVFITVVRPLNPGETDVCSSDPTIVNTQPSPPPGIPEWKWSFGIQYQFPAFGGSLTPRFDMSHQSHTNAANAASEPQGSLPGYSVANARLTWRSPSNHWQISGEVTNLFDKYYYLTNFDLRGAGAGFISAQPGRPREWALTVTRRF